MDTHFHNVFIARSTTVQKDVAVLNLPGKACMMTMTMTMMTTMTDQISWY